MTVKSIKSSKLHLPIHFFRNNKSFKITFEIDLFMTNFEKYVTFRKFSKIASLYPLWAYVALVIMCIVLYVIPQMHVFSAFSLLQLFIYSLSVVCDCVTS